MEKVSVALSLEEWRIIAFLVRQGSDSELERFLKDPTSHGADCIPSFRAAYVALLDQIPAY